MTTARLTLGLVILLAIFTQLASAQESKVVTITEPGIYELADLFKSADTVALLRVASGDTETYDVAVYKARWSLRYHSLWYNCYTKCDSISTSAQAGG